MEQHPFVHCRDTSRRFFAFDMFETLVQNKIGTVEPIFDILCKYYPGIEPHDISSTYHALSRKFKETHDNMELSIDRIIEHLDSVFGFHNDPASMEDPLLRYSGIYGLAEGADTTLEYLRDNGYRIGVLSNTRYHAPTLEGMLEDCGLLEYVDVVVTSADIGFRKPHREAYEAVADALHARMKDVFFCGDSLSNDYFGPLSAGMKAAVRIGPGDTREAKWSVRSIADVPSLFMNDP